MLFRSAHVLQIQDTDQSLAKLYQAVEIALFAIEHVDLVHALNLLPDIFLGP